MCQTCRQPKIAIVKPGRDLTLLGLLMQAGILEPFTPAHLRRHPQFGKGFIHVGCSDGSVFHTTYALCRDICRTIAQTRFIHPVAVAGGGLLLEPDSKIDLGASPKEAHRFVMAQLRVGIEHKKVRAVLLTTHAPCLAATMAKMDVLDQVAALMAAKMSIREEYPRTEGTEHVVIVPALLVQFNQRKRVLMFISIARWREYQGRMEELRLQAAKPQTKRRSPIATTPRLGLGRGIRPTASTAFAG